MQDCQGFDNYSLNKIRAGFFVCLKWQTSYFSVQYRGKYMRDRGVSPTSKCEEILLLFFRLQGYISFPRRREHLYICVSFGCNYATKPPVDGSIHVPVRWVSPPLFSASSTPSLQKRRQPKPSGSWWSLSWWMLNGDQLSWVYCDAEAKENKDRVCTKAAEKEELEMRRYRADKSWCGLRRRDAWSQCLGGARRAAA